MVYLYVLTKENELGEKNLPWEMLWTAKALNYDQAELYNQTLKFLEPIIQRRASSRSFTFK